MFGTRLAQLASTVAVSFLLAKLLGPDGRGVYALVILVPTTLFTVGQLGLPSAMVFFAGRGGRLRDLERLTFSLSLLVSAGLVGLALATLPAFEGDVLRAAPGDLLRIALLALPLRLVATLAGSVLYGRHAFRAYNLILAAQSLLAVALVVLIVGVLAAGVAGGIVAYLAMLAAGTVAVLVLLHRVVRRATDVGSPVSARGLLGYGLRLYPASVGNFFGYRADVFLLGWLVGSASQIGIYSVATSLAELVFNVPDSVSTVLFPRMASSERAEADRLAPAMSRLTIVATVAAAVALAPVAYLAILLLLPPFLDGIPALFILLPGIASLSVAKVLTSYLSGIDVLAPVAVASVVSLGVNVAVNLVTIPTWGITGAAFASLISYSLYAALMVVAASRAAGAPIRSFLIPGRDEVGRLSGAVRRLGGLG